MPSSTAAVSGDTVSFWSATIAAVGAGGLMCFVALPLALSSPFPTPKERVWIVEGAIRTASLGTIPVGLPAEDATEAEADLEGDESGPEGGHGSPADILSWEPTFTLASASMVEVDPDATGSLGSVGNIAGAAAVAKMPEMVERTRPGETPDEIDDYLWDVYLRNPIKKDGSGDFTWKDPAAAKRMGMSLKDYVIRGMDRDFRETLYHMGKALDADGYNWSMLSAFRDDFRQRLASGFKASVGNSLHGGSRRTGGYGHGRAIDITTADGRDAADVWHWIDRNGARFAMSRPMPGYDPAHIQARGNYQQIASTLRVKRSRYATATPRD
ncbi:hypothetical protein [Rhodoplanes roseus]|uniref:Uncharacterized protein n=1 Tax=Rhodoplanes roseus TaxID=29409 RepID=A0A327L0F8_9BRAD|nr:hypothetical protein [Rhodoplanes roseus]RAI43754.1 hypothetical protein CH341_12675 [Rhodoplanes roseus]